MSNKMKKYFSIFSLLIIAVTINAYELQKEDFYQVYNYALYRSWLQKSNSRTDVPTSFTVNGITQIYTQASGREIITFFPWSQHKVSNLIEKIEGFTDSSLQLTSAQEAFIGAFLYRLNAADSLFVNELFAANEIGLTYHGNQNDLALNMLWNRYRYYRYDCNYIKATSQEENGRLSLMLYTRQDSLTLILPKDLKDFTFPMESEVKFYSPEIKIEPRLEQDFGLVSTNSLVQHIALNHGKTINRELLHNKIDNFTDFLKTDLQNHSLSITGNTYILQKDSDQINISADLRIDKFDNQDGIEVYPNRDYELESKVLILDDYDKVNMSGLEQVEVEKIAPFITSLLYEHRSLGSNLLNFLLVHDNVPTTLIIHCEDRFKYEFDSYAELLLLLSKFWNKRVIYFGLSDFRKVNDYIEFKGILIADETSGEQQDFAEIWFHLSRDYKIDLVMMILYPENQKEG